MEVSDILRLARRWFWLLVLATLVGGTAGIVVNHFQKKMYQSDVMLFVSSPNHNDDASLRGDQQAAKALASFPQSNAVLTVALQSVSDKGLSLNQLAPRVTVDNNSDTQFVAIHVQDTDPQRAAQLATAIGRQSIALFQSSVDDTSKTQFEQNLQQEINTLAVQIDQEQKQLSNLQQQLANAEEHPDPNTVTQAVNVNQLSARITQLDADLGQLRQERGQLINSLTILSTIQIAFLQDAQVPQYPVGMGRTLAAAIGALIGLLAMGGMVIFIEQNDDVLRTREKVEKATGLSTLLAVKHLPTGTRQALWLKAQGAYVGAADAAEYSGHSNTTKEPITAANRDALLNGHDLEDDSPTIRLPVLATRRQVSVVGRKVTTQVQEVPAVAHGIGAKGKTSPPLWGAFLTLGIFLRGKRGPLAEQSNSGKSLLITSPEDGDGKTLIASQLAQALTATGVKVVLVDANLWQPEIHEIFGLSNSAGLSSILTASDVNESAPQFVNLTFGALQKTRDPNLSILSSGPASDLPLELLLSPRMTAIIQHLSEQAFVVLDAPPVLPSGGSVALASSSDGVLMVVNARHTTISRLKQSLEILARSNANIVGTVLNQVDRED